MLKFLVCIACIHLFCISDLLPIHVQLFKQEFEYTVFSPKSVAWMWSIVLLLTKKKKSQHSHDSIDFDSVNQRSHTKTIVNAVFFYSIDEQIKHVNCWTKNKFVRILAISTIKLHGMGIVYPVSATDCLVVHLAWNSDCYIVLKSFALWRHTSSIKRIVDAHNQWKCEYTYWISNGIDSRPLYCFKKKRT